MHTWSSAWKRVIIVKLPLCLLFSATDGSMNASTTTVNNKMSTTPSTTTSGSKTVCLAIGESLSR